MWFGSPSVFHDIVLSCGLPCLSCCEQKTGWISLTLMLVVNFSRKLSFAATVYHVWKERNARIFAGHQRTTCSLNAPILKRSGGMYVTDATFQE